jgi:hypothetical protein
MSLMNSMVINSSRKWGQMTSRDQSRDTRNLFRYLLAVSIFYVFLALSGITTSHNGAVFGGADETTTKLMGEVRQQRSDEFLRGSPRVIASLRGIDQQNYTPLDYSGSAVYQKQQSSVIARVNYYLTPVHIILAEKIADSIPLDMGFSLLWWFSTWVLFLAFPVWFYLLGMRMAWGVMCAAVIFFSPTNNWFSYLPSSLISQAVLSCCLLIVGVDFLHRRSWRYVTGGIILGAYSGRLAFTVIQYPPWGIPALLILAIVTLSFLVGKYPLREHFRDFGLVLLAGAGATLIVYIFNQKLYSATLETVYPGQRRESGGSVDQSLWSGGLAWFFQSNFARRANLTNPELIMGPTFVLIPALFLYIKSDLSSTFGTWRKKALQGALTFCLILFCWSQFRWPKWALHFNPLVMIPAKRADQILGVVVLIPLIFLIANTKNVRTKLGSSLFITAFAVGVSSRDMQSTQLVSLPESDSVILMLSVLFVAVITFSLLYFRSAFLRLLPLTVFLVASSVMVNPVVRGVGALGKSDAVAKITSLAEATPFGRWATSGYFQDALMISTGVPQLSGQQPFGPNKDVWQKIDTGGLFEENWNRGQAYIQFVWDPRKNISIWNPSPDVIQVVISPCDSRLQNLKLHWVTSAVPLDYKCLRQRGNVAWMGAPLFIYEIRNSSMFEDPSFDFSS